MFLIDLCLIFFLFLSVLILEYFLNIGFYRVLEKLVINFKIRIRYFKLGILSKWNRYILEIYYIII